jgi:hypothetical protein
MSQKDELTTRKQKLMAEAETTYVDKTLEANFECAGGHFSVKPPVFCKGAARRFILFEQLREHKKI